MLGLRINNYEVLSLIGEGGMGAVYLARHPFIGRQAAIKVLRPELARDPALVTRFMNEARAANAIRHPNLIDIIDVGLLPDGTPYLMMEYLEGESLGARLARQPPLPVRHAVDLACQAANALGAAHAQGIVHRDLKPDNLFLVPEPTAKHGLHLKVLDFGIAKLTGGMRNTPKTSTGVILGTPIYMSPEQCRGIPDAVDYPSDIYSLGVILFHMVCGGPPFVSDGVGELIAMHMFSEPPKPAGLAPDLPPRLEAVILRALAKTPDTRFSTMAELETALRAVEPTGADGKPAPGAGAPKPSRRPPSQESDQARAGRRVPASGRAKDSQYDKTKTVRRRSHSAVAIGACLLVAAAAVAGVVIARARRAPAARKPPASVVAKAPPATVPPPAPAPTRPTTISVSVATSPAGADVINTQDGQLLGLTPYQASFPRGKGTLQIVVEKAGYRPQPKTLSLAEDNALDLILIKEPDVGATERVRTKTKTSVKPKLDPDAMRKL
jgi:eukaryotic-like serine/threonine-protein kinase